MFLKLQMSCPARYSCFIQFLFFCLILLVGAILVTNQAAAQDKKKADIFERFKKPMPELPAMSPEEFRKETRLVSKKPYGKKELAYSMRIDKDWIEAADKTSANFMLSKKLFLELSEYYSPPTIAGRSRIVIEASNLEGNLTAEQWYIKYILEGGYTTDGFVTHSPNKVESLMVAVEDDKSYYIRTIVMINGSMVIMVKYFVPTAEIQKQAAMQEQVLASFSLTHKVKREYPEMDSYRFLDIVELKYPEGWNIVTTPIRNVDRLKATVLNVHEIRMVDRNGSERVSKNTKGKLDVLVISATVQNTLVEEIAEFKKKIEADGMLIGDRIPEEYNFSYADSMDFAITEVYSGIDTSSGVNDYEFWFTVMVGGNYYYIVMLLTPSRNDMFADWADNIQNYKRIVANFRPMSGAFVDRE